MGISPKYDRSQYRTVRHFMADQVHLLPILIAPPSRPPRMRERLTPPSIQKGKRQNFLGLLQARQPCPSSRRKRKARSKTSKTKTPFPPCPEDGCDKMMRRIESKKKASFLGLQE